MVGPCIGIMVNSVSYEPTFGEGGGGGLFFEMIAHDVIMFVW
jgi:hypothetical protein